MPLSESEAILLPPLMLRLKALCDALLAASEPGSVTNSFGMALMVPLGALGESITCGDHGPLDSLTDAHFEWCGKRGLPGRPDMTVAEAVKAGANNPDSN